MSSQVPSAFFAYPSKAEIAEVIQNAVLKLNRTGLEVIS